jgi:hypothetical protein
MSRYLVYPVYVYTNSLNLLQDRSHKIGFEFTVSKSQLKVITLHNSPKANIQLYLKNSPIPIYKILFGMILDNKLNGPSHKKKVGNWVSLCCIVEVESRSL